MISEFVKDEVPVRGEIDKDAAKEEQMRIRFAVTKMIKTWSETRDVYYSKKGKERLIKERKICIRRRDRNTVIVFRVKCQQNTESSLKQIMSK